jgi:hypothetical protein
VRACVIFNDHQVGETGVGDTDVNADMGEDFERGLNMWKGNTMEIAARLRKAEQERKKNWSGNSLMVLIRPDPTLRNN